MVSLIAITDAHEAEQVEALKTGMLDEPAHFNLHWLTRNRWVVVPVESAGHFNEQLASSLARAFETSKHDEVFAIATEPLENFPRCFLVRTSVRGLLDFSWRCAHFNFVLSPANRSCALMCTVYDYFLVAGPQEFVSSAVGGDIQIAWDEFDEVAADPCWEGRLQRIAERYRQIRLPVS